MRTSGNVGVGDLSTWENALAVMNFLYVCLSSNTGISSNHLGGAHLQSGAHDRAFRG